MGEKSSRARPARRKKSTAKSTVAKVPQPHGGALNAGGSPGNAGGGRPPKAFKDFLAELRRDPASQEALKTAAQSAGNKNFGHAWKVAIEYDDEKPAKKVELVTPLSTAEREARIQRILDRVKAS